MQESSGSTSVVVATSIVLNAKQSSIALSHFTTEASKLLAENNFPKIVTNIMVVCDAGRRIHAIGARSTDKVWYCWTKHDGAWIARNASEFVRLEQVARKVFGAKRFYFVRNEHGNYDHIK